MTDKQIKKYCDGLDCSWCSEEEPCIYRIANKLKEELQAKEQECDMWKNLTVDNGAVALKYQQQLDQLKAENEELKKIIERLDVPKHEVIDMDIALENDKLKVENEDLKKLIAQDQCFQNKSHKCVKSFYIDERYKQTLTEIKEIAESCGWNFGSEILYKRIEYILQKISECEVEK